MIFAPVIRHATYVAPRVGDAALQRFLHHTLTAPAAAPHDARATGVNVQQDDKAITVQLDVPGLSREQLGVTIEGNQVRVASAEGAPRRVQRAWELAQDIDPQASTARLEHGVLTLVLAKKPPQSSAVRLAID
ncbi:Hsp20/alpha crystallin family protein [Diaphorobacter nitroreducens]|uniref:Hsp20/alpha crystallin family protein n=1 Tax=Diaphorobacter nitroreducens TaxID=164759 RepID=UPI0028AB74B8|nr:Hsp20/alpha crystallin family protein [Diaphorobacter nitroreducens]